jgi:hypothetical protein
MPRISVIDDKGVVLETEQYEGALPESLDIIMARLLPHHICCSRCNVWSSNFDDLVGWCARCCRQAPDQADYLRQKMTRVE